MLDAVPQEKVCYWLQNLDYGTYLDVADSRTPPTAALIASFGKPSSRTESQEWVFKSKKNTAGEEVSTIVNKASRSLFLTTTNPPAIKFFRTPSAQVDVDWIVEVLDTDPNATKIIRLVHNDQLLSLQTPYKAILGPDTGGEKSLWRLIEVCALFSQTAYAYRLRSMNNHVLALDANGTFSAQTLNLPLLLSHRTLFVIEPADNGDATIKVSEGATNEFLFPKDTGGDGFTLTLEASFSWRLENIAASDLAYPFAYSMVMTGNPDLAITVDNDQDIILKSFKMGHGQIWFFEPMSLAAVDEEKKKIADERKRIADAEAAERKRLADIAEAERKRVADAAEAQRRLDLSRDPQPGTYYIYALESGSMLNLYGSSEVWGLRGEPPSQNKRFTISYSSNGTPSIYTSNGTYLNSSTGAQYVTVVNYQTTCSFYKNATHGSNVYAIGIPGGYITLGGQYDPTYWNYLSTQSWTGANNQYWRLYQA